MTDGASIGVAFIVGVVLTVIAAFILFRRYHFNGEKNNRNITSQVLDLKSQLTNQADNFGRAIAEKNAEIDRITTESRAKLREAEDKGFEGGKRHAEQRLKDALDNVRIVVKPYVQHTVEKGGLLDAFRDKHRIESGYMYRLTIMNVPCLVPHYELLDLDERAESDPKLIEAATKIAIESARAAAKAVAAVAGGNNGGQIISFDETPEIKNLNPE